MLGRTGLILSFALLFSAFLNGQINNETPTSNASSGVQRAAPAFDVNAAVESYLAKMSPAQRDRSNAYFEGGYWLSLWDFLIGALVMWLLLSLGWSAAMRNLAERITRLRPLQTA